MRAIYPPKIHVNIDNPQMANWRNIRSGVLRCRLLVGTWVAVLFIFSADAARVPPLIKTNRIYAVPDEFATGTIFDDRTGWGDTTTYIVTGRSPEFSKKLASGWVRFDTSIIPDVAVIKSIKFSFNVYKREGDTCQVNLIQLSHDPMYSGYHVTWFDLKYGSRYAVDIPLSSGLHEMRLHSDANGQLQRQLRSDWFAVGFVTDESTEKSSGFSYIHGWDTNERPYIEVEYLIKQRILSAKWVPPLNIIERDVATMIAEVEGYPFEVEGEWKIFENDILGDDEVPDPKIKTYPMYQEAGRFFMKAEWSTVWLRDRKKIPDYYFELSLGSQTKQSSRNFEDMLHITRAEDLTPPRPSPAAFVTKPYSNFPTSIAMVAAEVVDPEEYEVEYYFACEPNSGGGNDSGWISSREYLDGGLQPNSYYGYKVLGAIVRQTTTKPLHHRLHIYIHWRKHRRLLSRLVLKLNLLPSEFPTTRILNIQSTLFITILTAITYPVKAAITGT